MKIKRIFHNNKYLYVIFIFLLLPPVMVMATGTGESGGKSADVKAGTDSEAAPADGEVDYNAIVLEMQKLFAQDNNRDLI